MNSAVQIIFLSLMATSLIAAGLISETKEEWHKNLLVWALILGVMLF